MTETKTKHVVVNESERIFIHYNPENHEVRFVYSKPTGVEKKPWKKHDEVLIDLSQKTTAEGRAEKLEKFLTNNQLTGVSAVDLFRVLRTIKK